MALVMSVTFLQQSFLWGILAISIPIIIHLLNRRRFRTVQWAAMDFLLRAARESRGKKKLKYLIILTCRALAIAALIFAVARPLVGGFLSWGGSNIDTVILILDRSASMEQQIENGDESKRLRAIKSVQESLQAVNNPRLILIDSASAEPQVIPSPDALAELSTTAATDTKASIPSLISRAIDHITESSLGQTEIWLASDLQDSDWGPEEGRWDAVRTGLIDLPQDTALRIIAMTSPVTDNASIKVLSARRIDKQLALEIEITRSEGNSSSTIPVTYSMNDNRSSEAIKLDGQTYRYQKNLELGTREGEGYGFVAIPSDANPRDNVAFFAYGERRPAQTYLVSEGGESGKWLSLAAAPTGLDDHQCQLLSPQQIGEIKWQEATLVIWQAPLPEGDTAKLLSDYIEGGGALLVFPPNGESKASFLGIHWGEISSSPQSQYFIIDDWNRTDGPLRNGIAGTAIAVSKLKAIKRRNISGEFTTLAFWSDEKPFLGRRVIGDGTAVFITSLPDYSWSNLGDADVLLPVPQRLINLGGSRFSSAYSAIAGSPRARPANKEIRTRVDRYSDSSTSSNLYEAGVWKIGDRLLATNRPHTEDDWTFLDESRIQSLLEGTQFSFFSEGSTSKPLVNEIWRALMIAMLLFLISEAFLCLQPKKDTPQNLKSSSLSR